MTVLMTCPSCDSRLKVPEQLAGTGKTLKCPRCAERIPLVDSRRKAPASRADLPASKKAAPPPPPPSPADKNAKRANQADAPTSGLLGETSWMLRFKEHFFFTNFSNKRYELFQPGTKDMAGVIDERPAWWVKILRGFPQVRRFLPNKYEVRDVDGEGVLFTVRYNGFSFRKRIEVVDADDQLVAAFVLKLFTLTTNFTVYGADDEQIGDFRFQFADFRNGKAPRVSLLLDGTEQGSVTGEEEMALTRQIQEGKKAAFKVSFMPQKSGLYIAVNPACATNSRVKMQMLAAALVLKLFGFDKMFQGT
jgi:predicted Zn finger-like uncharacterized protein